MCEGKESIPDPHAWEYTEGNLGEGRGLTPTPGAGLRAWRMSSSELERVLR